ncbi:MAG: hypothetical protein R3Y63_08755 [Eubacteriales bacterium]
MCQCHCDQCSGDFESPEPDGIYFCEKCSYSIHEDDWHIEVDGLRYCEHCIEQLSQAELLKLLDIPILGVYRGKC